MITERLRMGVALAAACVVTIAITLFFLTIVNRNSSFGTALALGILLLVVALLLPLRTLPAAALIAYAAIPARLLPESAMISLMPIGTALLVIWRIRVWMRATLASDREVVDSLPGASNREPTHVVAGVFAGLFVAWAVISAFVHSTGLFGIGWLVSFCVAVFISLTVREAHAEARILRRAWVIAGAIAGCYAILEFATGGSPLFGALYEAVGAQSSQHWSVYRAEVSFGHPLFAGAFLAVATALSATTWVSRGGRLYLLAALLSAAGVVATLSRGSMVATIVAVATGLLLSTFARRRGRFGRVLSIAVITAIAVTIVFQLEAFNERANSVEADLSAGARDTGLAVAFQAAQYSQLLGTGPASSGQTAAIFDTVVIENSFLQVLISLGLPGLLALVGFLVSVFVVALRAGRLAEATALIALGIALAGFNGIDAVRATHLTLGLVVFLALHAPVIPRQADDGGRTPGSYRGGRLPRSRDASSARHPVAR